MNDMDVPEVAEVPAPPPPEIPKAHNNGTLLSSGDMREKLARHAIVLRKAGKTIEEIAAEFKVGRASLVLMCDVIALHERTDLSERDAAIVQDAFVRMRAGQRLTDIKEMIAEIASRVWGNVSARGASRDRAEQRRRERFEQAIGVALQACANTTRVEIAHLSPERAKAVYREITEALQHLQATRTKIGGMR